mmetsp:Transcript_10674/g.25158  ORF Transcript_10674/g.25158 Transcript_10674/m.25158 type:complete len:205 (+) Transcript_10674:833-1447(+)
MALGGRRVQLRPLLLLVLGGEGHAVVAQGGHVRARGAEAHVPGGRRRGQAGPRLPQLHACVFLTWPDRLRFPRLPNVPLGRAVPHVVLVHPVVTWLWLAISGRVHESVVHRPGGLAQTTLLQPCGTEGRRQPRLGLPRARRAVRRARRMRRVRCMGRGVGPLGQGLRRGGGGQRWRARGPLHAELGQELLGLLRLLGAVLGRRG